MSHGTSEFVVTAHSQEQHKQLENGSSEPSCEGGNMKWTNATLRAHLGERGFLQHEDTVKMEDRFYTNFSRGDDELVLVEFVDESEPVVFQDGQPVDATNIGYRNEQIQHKPLLGD